MDKIPNIIIIEDHPVMRGGLVSYFTGTRRWNVSGAVSNIEEAKTLFSSLYGEPRPRGSQAADLLLIDIQLESEWGLDIIPWLKENYRRQMPVMAVYSTFDDFAHVSTALSMGIRGYICKRSSESELENALFDVMEGRTYIDSSAQARLDTNANLFKLLTKRETDILSLIKKNLTNKEIASRLGINQRTVENILCCVYDKTGIRSRVELQIL